MTGHSPAATVDGDRPPGRGTGITTMLPTEDAIWVGEELTRRFGLPRWLFTLTATDANRAALRIARQITGRPQGPRLLLLLPRLGRRDVRGRGHRRRTVAREGNVGAPVDPATTTVAVEFNDLDALERRARGRRDRRASSPSRR